ncbi:MAG: M48 family metallopeptidase [Candidatus Methanoplasma sp.]|jgi:hypothetical protein|nr:M48 family metallopeptidase [Candidatus Methanoplasma sp.]
MVRNDERLFRIVSRAVSDNGLDLRSAVFREQKEFGISWKRSGKNIDISVSDYLADAPYDVLEDFSGTVAGTIAGKRPGYGKTYLDWVKSDDFICSSRKIYLKRSRNLTGRPDGRGRDITESLDRLLDSGLLRPENIDNSFFSWTRRPGFKKVGFCSPMMRVVGVSSALDDAAVPEYVLDYVVYHESLHLAQGYRPGERAHDRTFRLNERKYPLYEEAEKYLRTLASRPE